MLADGTYDAFVVDARIDPDGSQGSPRRTRLDLTITTGEHKGELVEVTAVGLPGEEFDLIGMPATLTVADGIPAVRIDNTI